MSDTRVLLTRIAALRQRMEQGQARPSAGDPVDSQEPDRVRRLEGQVAAGHRFGTLLDGSFRQLSDNPAAPAQHPVMPAQLTARARRLLLVGQKLLTQVRSLEDFFGTEAHHDNGDPLATQYRDTVAMLDTALRTVQAYPDSPSAQLRLCDGLEAILCVVTQRCAALEETVGQRRREADRIQTLAELLSAMEAERAVDIAPLMTLAEGLIADAEQAAPMHFHQVPLEGAGNSNWLARVIACHGLTTAQVAARLARHDPEFRAQPLEPVMAALLHDVGMLRVPLEVYLQKGPLEEEQRRLVEGHTRIGAELCGKVLPKAGWLTEAVTSHHERRDGTGYPNGLRELQIAPIVRLLAVCDVYAAMCAPRPYRPAREPRTALTDTLLLADKGALDRTQAERLLQLSFYPIGSVVELADGAIGTVVASPQVRRDLSAPARPVVALLTNSQGQFLPTPRHLNLAECEDRTIVRSLMPAERRQLLGKRYPELA